MKKITVKGAIVPNADKWIYDWFEMEAVCPKDIEQGLSEAAGEPVTVEVNSGGGDMFAASEMYYLLHDYPGQITADIVGFAGSAATIVCCGANKVRAVPTALYMIHNVATSADGDYHAMDQTSSMLQTANRAVAQAYMHKTGLDEKELLKLMDKESWLDVKTAKEKGFIDEIIGDTAQGLRNGSLYNAAASFGNILSPEVIVKIRNTVRNPTPSEPDFFTQQKMQSQLKLLQLKGEMRNDI